MGSPVVNPNTVPGLDPATAEILRKLNEQNGGQVPALPPSPAPSPSPAPGQTGFIAGLLQAMKDKFMGGTSAKELAAPVPPQTGTISPEELWKLQHPGQPFPGGR
jgi:hypothetical protein